VPFAVMRHMCMITLIGEGVSIELQTSGYVIYIEVVFMVKRCAKCKMRFHKCFCRITKPKVIQREPRQEGQSTIDWNCSPKEQLMHWRNRRF
jgi:hypothetical protein